MKQFDIDITDATLTIKRSVFYNILQTIKWFYLLSLIVYQIYCFYSSIIVIALGVALFVIFVSPNTYITEPLLTVNRDLNYLKYYHHKEPIQVVAFNKVELVLDDNSENLFLIGLIASSGKSEDNSIIFRGNLGYFSEDQPMEIASIIASFLKFELIHSVEDEE